MARIAHKRATKSHRRLRGSGPSVRKQPSREAVSYMRKTADYARDAAKSILEPQYRDRAERMANSLLRNHDIRNPHKAQALLRQLHGREDAIFLQRRAMGEEALKIAKHLTEKYDAGDLEADELAAATKHLDKMVDEIKDLVMAGEVEASAFEWLHHNIDNLRNPNVDMERLFNEPAEN